MDDTRREMRIDELCREVPHPIHGFLLGDLAWESYEEDPNSHGKLLAPRIVDPLIANCARGLGGLEGREVLELGPYEGYHAVALERQGVKSVVSIEANPRNWIKCLVVKEFYRLQRVEYLLGDVGGYLKSKPRRFDLILASGILYHLARPFETLELILAMTDAVGVCTTFYDPDDLMFKFTGETREVSFPGTEPFVLHKRENPTGTLGKKHGIDDAAWMFTRDDLLRYFDYRQFDVELFPYIRAPDSGPRVRFLAKRRASPAGPAAATEITTASPATPAPSEQSA